MAKLKTNTHKVKLDDINYGVRAAQLATNYGPGSLVEFSEQTLITAAPEYWATQVTRINDLRLAQMLKVDYFGIPTSDRVSHFDGVSYIQFPEWYYCHKCHRFQPVKKWISDYKVKKSISKDEAVEEFSKRMRCPFCNASLIVSRIVVACENGHIDDFPWVDWVHAMNMGGPRKVCQNPSLKISTAQGGSEGLESIEVTCSCHARARLGGAFGKNTFQGLRKKFGDENYHFKCTGRHPWKFSYCDCQLSPRTMNRGSSALYFPVNIASIVIPPYSQQLLKKIEESQGMKKLLDKMEDIDEETEDLSPEKKQSVIHKRLEKAAYDIAVEIGADENKVLSLLEKRWAGKADDTSEWTEDGYKAQEYLALNGEFHFSDGSAKDDFQREGTDVSKYGLPFLKGVSLINKIREVVALTGFTRINPIGSAIDQRNHSAIVPVKEPETKWYPAYQVYGEGIFLEFNESAIKSWIKRNPDVIARAEYIQKNYKESYFGKVHNREITPKFILLHTLSHLLIKQLSFECGYGVSSLKERIYCSDDENHKMAGILIYTASGDSEGTMGGLVRQGRHDLFPAIFKKAVEMAQLCSNDPVCSLSQGQGRDNLNLAACHSCTLIPETSCEEFNGLLDRGMLVGIMSKDSFGFFTPYIKNGWGAGAAVSTGDDEGEEEPDASGTKGQDSYIIGLKPDTGVIEASWNSACQGLLKYATTEEEKAWLGDLKKQGHLFGNKEYPIRDAVVVVHGEDEEFTVDLLWKQSRVVYLSEENEEASAYFAKSDWACVMAKNGLTPDEFASKLQERHG